MKFYDTSALLDLGAAAFEPASATASSATEPFLIADMTLHELEEIKTSGKKSEEIRYKARTVTRLLAEHHDDNTFMVVAVPMSSLFYILDGKPISDNNDATIMATARWYLDEMKRNLDDAIEAGLPEAQRQIQANIDSFKFVTSDLSCANIASGILSLPIEFTYPDAATSVNNNYTGQTEVTLDEGGEEAMAMAYQTHDEGYTYQNLFDTPVNGYLIVRDPDTVDDDMPAGNAVGWLRWNGKKYVPLKYKKISNRFTGDVKPLNDQQKLAFDMLQNDDITVKMLAGTFGSGKTMLMVSSAIDMIEKHKVEKLIWIRNNIEVKNTKELGALPGTLLEKLGAASFAGPLADHLGGEAGLEYWINNGQVEVAHLGFIRGRDYKNAIIMVSEAENLTKEHVQLLLGRVGEGSMLWLDGDLKQTDEAVFENNSGMRKAIQCLAGNPHFGYVYLNKTERSETAQLADLLD